MSLFCCVAGISVIPACHWVWLNGGMSSDVVQVRSGAPVFAPPPPRASCNAAASVQLFLPRVMVMYLIAGAAFLFYVTKIPERYFPGESCRRWSDGTFPCRSGSLAPPTLSSQAS